MCIEHHVLPYINFIRKELSKDTYKTEILVYTQKPSETLTALQNNELVISHHRKDVVDTVKKANISHKVILHGLYDSVIFLNLLFTFTPLKFVSWAMWGADVYFTPPKGIKGLVINFCRRKVIPRIGNKIGLHCDYTWLFNHLGVEDKGSFKELCFPAWFYQDDKIIGQTRKNKDSEKKRSALIGNSAESTNNFLSLIDLLKHSILFKKYTFILNYGGTPEYIDEVKRYASECLKNCELVFLTEKLTYPEFYNLVSQHDALIYNHSRQQGVGSLNIAIELCLDVFLPSNNPMTANYDEWSIKVLPTESLSELSCDELNNEITKINNQSVIRNLYHPKKVAIRLNEFIENER